MVVRPCLAVAGLHCPICTTHVPHQTVACVPCCSSSALQAIPTAAEFLTFTWDGSEGSFATQAEAKAAFLEALKKVSGACWGCRSPCPAEG